MEFSWPVRVYIEDTDAGGIVYYVNYLKFMERARTEFLRHLGHDHADMIEQGSMFVVHSLDAKYKAPARLDDQLRVSVAVQQLKAGSVVFLQRVFRQGDSKVLAESNIKVACVDTENMKPQAMPEEMKAALKNYFSD